MSFRVGSVATKDKPGTTKSGVSQGNWLVIVETQLATHPTATRTTIEELTVAVFDTKEHAEDFSKQLVAAQGAASGFFARPRVGV